MSTVLSKYATFNYDVSDQFDAHCLWLQLVNSFVISRIYYCNSILLRLSKNQQDRLQSVLNVAACLIYRRNRYDHITYLFRDRLHCFRVPQRITFSDCLLVYKSLHGLAPAYIGSSCIQKVNYSTSIWAALSLPRWLGYSGDREQVLRTFFCSGRTFGLERTTGVI